MQVNFERKALNGSHINIYNADFVTMGFTETRTTLRDLAALFRDRELVELKQVHSDIIRHPGKNKPGAEWDCNTEGDGIILDRPDRVAVIKTADCTPLFFWDQDGSIGGVLHIGWQGLLKSIEKKLLERLAQMGVNPAEIFFYMGPAIEKSCYEVGPDLYEKFAVHGFCNHIFESHPLNRGKFVMDVKRGIRLSLEAEGVPGDRIGESGLCTYCDSERFPSYRRHRGSGQRIYSFLTLFPRPCRA